MKNKTKLKFITCMILLVTISLSCTNKDDSFPPYSYSIKLGVKDQAGNDKVHGIPSDQLYDNYYEVKK